MADKELGITATAMIDNALTELQSLVSGIQGLPDSTTLTVNVEGNAAEVVSAINSDFDSMRDSASVAGEEISNSMNSAASSVQGVGSNAKDAADQTAEIGDQAEETGTKAQDGFGLAEASVIAFLATLELAAQGMDNLNISFDRMSSATLPEGNLRNMVADITDVTMNADEALTYVTTLKRMGLTTEDSLRRGATAMNVLQEGTRGTQEDVQGLVASFRTLGVDVDQLPSTYNAVAYANANMVNGIKDYNSLMGRYAYRFKEMGLSADQSAVLLVAAQRKYGPNMRAMYTNLNSLLEESGGNLSYIQGELGLYNNELVNAGNVTGQYSGKLEQNTNYAREHTTVLQQTGAAVEDTTIKYGDLLSTMASFGSAAGAVLGGATIGIPAVLKVFDKLYGSNLSGQYTKWLGKNFIEPAKGLGGRILSGVSSIGGDIIGRLFPESAIDTTKMFGLADYAKYYGYAEEGGKSIGQKLISGIKGVVPSSIDDLFKIIFKGGGKPLSAGMLFTKQDFVGEEGSSKRSMWEDLFSSWGMGQSDLDQWNAEMNMGPIATFKANTKSLYDFVGWIQGQVNSISPLDWMNLLGVNTLSARAGEVQAWTWETWQWIQTLWPQINLNKIDWWNIFGLDWLGPYADMVELEFDDFVADLGGVPGKLYDLGWDMIGQLKEGILDRFPELQAVLDYISDHFPKSPPKTGPLALVTAATMQEYGSNLATGLEEGVNSYVTPEVQPMSFDNYEVPDAIKAWYDTASRTVSASLGDTGGGGYGRSISQDQGRVRGATSQFSSSSSGKEALNKADAAAAPSASQQAGWQKWFNGMAKQAWIDAYYKAPKYEFIKDPAPVIQARRQVMLEQTHLQKYGETMASAQERFRKQYGFIDRNSILAHFPGAKSSGESYSGFRYSDAYMEAHATPVIPRGYALPKTPSWGSSPSRAGSSAAAAAAAAQPQYQMQTIEGQSVVVHINDPVIRSDMDIKTISNELGREIGRKARQNGIGVMIR